MMVHGTEQTTKPGRCVF